MIMSEIIDTSRKAVTKGSACCRVVFLLLIISASPSGAVGIRLPNQDPEGIARGNAFAATADNPSAIYYNPAGITQLQGQQLRAGLYLISANTEFSSPGGDAETDAEFQPVPQLYYTLSLQEKLPLTFGLGIYAPYGLSVDWGENNPFRTAAQSGKLLYASINPVVAWRVNSCLSLAIGPTFNYSEADLKQGLTPFNPQDHFKFEGNAFGVGFNAGLLWQPHPQWSFGVNYRSATELDYDGTSRTTPTSPFPYYPETSTETSLDFPQFIAAGISYRPNEKWNFEIDVDWTDWDVVNTIFFRGTPLGDIPFVFNYESSFMYEFGATRQLANGYFISFGYIYSENSIPDRDFNPIVPDSDLHLGSIGFGHHGQRWDWALGYHFAYNGGREISNNTNPSVDGTYKTFNNAVNISATFKF